MSVKLAVLGLLLTGLVMWTTADPVANPVLPRMGLDVGPVSEESVRRLMDAVETLQHQNADIRQKYTDIQRKLQEQEAESHSSQLAAGAVYVRWGRTVCEGDATILYAGFTSGALYTNVGTGSNVLCLADLPTWGNYTDGVQTTSATIYGTEYRLDASTGSPFSTRNNGGSSLANHDAPCVVCQATTRQTHVMIPARTSCPANWTAEYWGYLVSGGYITGHYKSSYICLDEAPEVIANSVGVQGSVLLYPVQARCGALPCPGYFEGREVACVVCTK